MSQKIILASNNPGKLREIQAVVDTSRYQLIAQSELQIGEVPETGTTFVENAIIKARHAAQQSGVCALADDSGIEVDALLGAPGVHSARFAGEQANDVSNNEKLLAALEGVPDHERNARFHCIIVYMRHALDPMPILCQGTWEGRILHKVTGSSGFGYDPLFYVPTHGCSSAQLDPMEKNRISHRAQALQKLMRVLY
ncbi:MAG: RdgB/HAM1 family non-canonical purine NTP pyrophosphatase [Gammaproteobacteria bacterium]|nr:RdgB/HAM1 family non-canonical purine NTP pyrophosphatase [Gammaproteobacteria bacterium]